MTEQDRARDIATLSEAFKLQVNHAAQQMEAAGVPTQEVIFIVLCAMAEFAGKLIYEVGLAANPRDEFHRESVRLISGYVDTVIGDLMATEKARRQ